MDRGIFTNKDVVLYGNAPFGEVAPPPGCLLVRFSRQTPCNVIFWDSGQWDDNWSCPQLKLVCAYAWNTDCREREKWCKKNGVDFDVYATPIKGLNNPTWGPWWPVLIQEQIDTRPFSGIIAIQRAINEGARSIFLVNWNFYTPRGEKPPVRIGGHFVKPNILWLLRAAEDHPELTWDQELENVISPFRSEI